MPQQDLTSKTLAHGNKTCIVLVLIDFLHRTTTTANDEPKKIT